MDGGQPGRARLTVLLASPDAYVAHVLEQGLPGVTVVRAGIGDLGTEPGSPPDAVVADVGFPGIDDLLNAPGAPPVIGLLDRANGPAPPDLSAVVMRPIVPAELCRVVSDALGIGEPRPGATSLREHHWLGVLIATSVGIAALVNVVTRRFAPLDGLVLGAAIAYAIWGMYRRRTTSGHVWVGAAVAAVAVATGDIDTGYVAFGLLVALQAGVHTGFAGALAGAAVSAGWYVGLVTSVASPALAPGRLVAWLSLFPLAALAGAYVRRLRVTESAERLAALERTHRMLSQLNADASAFAGTVFSRHALDAAVDALRSQRSIKTAVILRHELGLLNEVAAIGCQGETTLLFTAADALARGLLERERGPLEPSDLPASIGARMSPDGVVRVVPVQAGGATYGTIVASVARNEERRATAVLDDVAKEVALGLDNARLFERLREISVDDERLRLAAELHEGVAQQLAHLRFELDRLAGRPPRDPPTLRRELGRLAGVVSDALAEVRSVLYGLNGSVAGAGLGTTISSYLREVRALDRVGVDFRIRGLVNVSPQVEVELFRIAREVVESMLDAGSSRLDVHLAGDGGSVELVMEGDRLEAKAGDDLARSARSIGAEIAVDMSAAGAVVRVCLEHDPMEVFVSARKEAS